jgi:hypothetical protein
LVDMYSKCGSMENTLREWCDVIFWNDILGGCVMHGHGKQSIKHFEQIYDKGVQSKDTTFVWLLSCRFSGWRPVLFTSLITVYTISAKLEH